MMQKITFCHSERNEERIKMLKLQEQEKNNSKVGQD